MGVAQDRLHTSELLFTLGELEVFLCSIASLMLVSQLRIASILSLYFSCWGLTKKARDHSLVRLLLRLSYITTKTSLSSDGNLIESLLACLSIETGRFNRLLAKGHKVLAATHDHCYLGLLLERNFSVLHWLKGNCSIFTYFTNLLFLCHNCLLL